MGPIHEPHDSLFKLVFSNLDHARAEILSILPESLTRALDLSTLEHCPGTFIDPEYRKGATDLLFSVSSRSSPDASRDRVSASTDDDARSFIYFLLEHQSRNDRWMALRLWVYLGIIWQSYVQNHPGATRLPLIIPIVIHHSAAPWSAGGNLCDLLDAPAAACAELGDKLPRLGYYLDDLGIQRDDDLHSRAMDALPRLALWTLKNARHAEGFAARMREYSQLFLDVVLASNGVHALGILLRYILQVSDAEPDDIEAFTQDLHPLATEAFMTGAEKLQQRARNEERLNERRNILIMQLQQRFSEIPDHAMKRIERADPDQLWAWIERLTGAKTLDQVFAETADEPPVH